MGRYAYLVSPETKRMLFLGKALGTPPDALLEFHMGPPDRPKNWEQRTLNRALWKFLAENAGGTLQVIVDDSFPERGDYVEIGGDLPQDVSFETYLADETG